MADYAKRKRRWGRWLFGTIIVLLAIGYTILWFLTKPMIESFADDWVAEQKRAGIDIQFKERHVEGFPFNFELVFEEAIIVSAPTNVRLEAEQVRLHSRPWNFYPMLANWWGEVEGYAPGKMIIKDPNGDTHELNMNSASRLVIGWDDEGLTNANLILDELSAIIDGENFDTDEFIVAVTPSSNLTEVFDINLSWDRINVPGPWLAEARAGLSDAPPMFAGMVSGLLNELEAGDEASFPMPNALSLGDEIMLFGVPLN